MSKARDIASAAPAPSTVSATELGYVDGVTSAIQTQLDAKTAKSTLTTTGDIYYASAANTPARLGIGSTGNVLTVASGIPSWAAPASGALTLISTTTIGSGVTFATVTGAFSSTYDNYLITINGGVASEANDLKLQLGSTTTGYYYFGYYGNASSTSLNGDNGNNVSTYRFVALGDTSNLSGEFILQNPNLAKATMIYATGTRTGTGGMTTVSGSETSTTQHTAFTLTASSGTITGGKIRVYGYSNS
jgi:hypothetical protein